MVTVWPGSMLGHVTRNAWMSGFWVGPKLTPSLEYSIAPVAGGVVTWTLPTTKSVYVYGSGSVSTTSIIGPCPLLYKTSV